MTIEQIVLEKCKGHLIIGILSCDSNGVIGNKGKMLWHIPEEPAFFRGVIRSNTLIMGRRTFESMPQSILKSRTSLVFSKKNYNDTHQVKYFSSLEKFQKSFSNGESEVLFMIGGAEITKLFIKFGLISKFILTKVVGEYQGDARIDLEIFNGWSEEKIRDADAYSIYVLTKIAPQ